MEYDLSERMYFLSSVDTIDVDRIRLFGWSWLHIEQVRAFFVEFLFFFFFLFFSFLGLEFSFAMRCLNMQRDGFDISITHVTQELFRQLLQECFY